MERIVMRTLRSTEAQMRVIETILASFIIVFALSFVNMFAIVPTSPKYELTDLEKMGYSALHDLDQNGLLASFIYNEEWENVTAALNVMLPVDLYFNMTVYDLDGTVVNNAKIFYGDQETFGASNNIASVTYVLVGYGATYKPRILILQLARG